MKIQIDIHILVTGFDNFHGSVANSSDLIASSLPPLPDFPGLPVVHIYYPSKAIRVEYTAVTEAVQHFWDPNSRLPNFDMALHIGMAGLDLEYRLENIAYRDEYIHEDEKGLILEDSVKLPEWERLPEALVPDFDVEGIFEQWREFVDPSTKLAMSYDAGRFLCEFIFFTSMAALYLQNRPKKVLFLHVPSVITPDVIAKGREVTLHLIHAMVTKHLSDKVATAPA